MPLFADGATRRPLLGEKEGTNDSYSASLISESFSSQTVRVSPECMPSPSTLKRNSTLQSVDQARNVVLEVNDLQLFVLVYFIEVGKVETSYIEIYNHLANEFGRL